MNVAAFATTPRHFRPRGSRGMLTLLIGVLAMTCQASAQDSAVRDRSMTVLRGGLAATGSDAFWPAMHAAEGLTDAGAGTEVRRALEPRLATEDDPRRRCGLARELVRAGDAAQVAILADILAGDDPRGHTHAAESLFKVDAVGDRAALERAAGEGATIGLRLMAAAALVRSGRPEQLATIRAALRGQDPDGIHLAAWILGQIGDATDVEPLRARLADAPTPLVGTSLEHALAMRGDAEGQAALERNLVAGDDATRAAAANAAGMANAAATRSRLVRLLDDPALDVRIRAAHALVLLDRSDAGAAERR